MKKISAVAINSLIEALANIYWYKRELRNFLLSAISNQSVLNRVNWDDPKIVICSNLINYMKQNENVYQNDLLNLIYEVINMNDFSHLKRLEDGQRKLKIAVNAVEALKKHSINYFHLQNEQEHIEHLRKKHSEKVKKNSELVKRLNKIRDNYLKLVTSDNAQQKGYQLEQLLYDIFSLFDLDPKASFKIEGEQIDGAFTIDSTDFLLEAKWTSKPISNKDLYSFEGKLSRKLENTLGLFISINGYTEPSIKAYSSGRKLMILMDGEDLMAVLDGRIDFYDLLTRKRRHASQTGEIYLRIDKILS